VQPYFAPALLGLSILFQQRAKHMDAHFSHRPTIRDGSVDGFGRLHDAVERVVGEERSMARGSSWKVQDADGKLRFAPPGDLAFRQAMLWAVVDPAK